MNDFVLGWYEYPDWLLSRTHRHLLDRIVAYLGPQGERWISLHWALTEGGSLRFLIRLRSPGVSVTSQHASLGVALRRLLPYWEHRRYWFLSEVRVPPMTRIPGWGGEGFPPDVTAELETFPLREEMQGEIDRRISFLREKGKRSQISLYAVLVHGGIVRHCTQVGS